MDESSISAVFSNLDFLINIHVEMLNEFKKRFNDWNPQSSFGDIFLNQVRNKKKSISFEFLKSNFN